MYNLTPDHNIDLDLLKAKVASLRIESETDNIEASRLLGEIDNAIEDITGSRDNVISEYEKRIEDTKNEYAPYISALVEFKKTVKNEMLAYRERAKIELNRIHDEINSGSIERHDIYVDENGKIINKSALSIRTGEGLSSVRKHYNVVITDFTMIPDAYKKFDKKKAIEDAKKGIKNIPGIEIIEKEAIQYRGKSTKAA